MCFYVFLCKNLVVQWKNTGNLENVVIGSMLGTRRSLRQVFQSTRPFVRIKIIHVSNDSQTLTTISHRDFENELDKDSKIRPNYDGAWLADRRYAGTCNLQLAVNRQPGYRQGTS